MVNISSVSGILEIVSVASHQAKNKARKSALSKKPKSYPDDVKTQSPEKGTPPPQQSNGQVNPQTTTASSGNIIKILKAKHTFISGRG